MKYLKIYEEFEPSSSLKEDIKDIFIDLTDNYLGVEVDDWGKILITKTNELSTKRTDYNFDIDSNIIDSILRLIDYLKSNKLYVNNIIIQKFVLKPIKMMRGLGEIETQHALTKWVIDDLYVSNITEEGLFTSKFNDKTNKYESELFTEPVNKIIIKYSNCL
jgi:hypothetical protein